MATAPEKTKLQQTVNKTGKSDLAKVKLVSAAPIKPATKIIPVPKLKPVQVTIATVSERLTPVKKPAPNMTFQDATRRNVSDEYLRAKLKPKSSLFGSNGLFSKKGK